MATEVFSLPVSTSLLAEVNAVGAPGRNKAQDGTIGDRAHMDRTSDHNLDEIGNTGSSSDSDKIPEVHARDVDARGPWLIQGGAERIVQLIVSNVRAMGYAKRRVKYVIYRARIWEWRQADGAWQFLQRAYSGADLHYEHFHVSFMYGSGAGASNPENNTSPWGILAAYQEEDMPLSDADLAKIKNLLEKDGAVARGLRQQPNNLSDTERGKLADVVTGKTLAALTPLLAAGKVDVKALVSELVGPLTASVLAALPQDQDGVVTAEELQAGIVGALRELAEPAAE